MNDFLPSQAGDLITAAVLVIGDEILSGRTKDKNIGYIAEYLTAIGIDLREVRVVPDIEEEIIAALDALRHKFTYVFTTGGIGPTHDDITADCVAKAFGVQLVEDPRAMSLLLERIKPEDMNEARRRMARIPVGGELVLNSVSKAPGFMIGNVIVMAGVPAVMQAMLEDVAPKLRTGVRMSSANIDATGFKEGDYAAGLGAIQKRHPGIVIGSYPSLTADGVFRNQIVVRARDLEAIEAAAAEVRAMLASLKV
ncbi:MAG: competence/damage-inducible protein A [Beijerinckiaceae bacterium]|nr:competence/damage-inducible protein A [Beijerinckiaceae bacterium]